MNAIPKKIWILWLQGWDSAPEIVKKCAKSWERQNPSWEIIRISENNIADYIDVADYLSCKNMPIQALSDIVRILLLEKYGGVWVDASVFCTQPLDEWIHEAVKPSGFFAFSKPFKNFKVSSWFLAATINSAIIRKQAQSVRDFWDNAKIAPRWIWRLYQKKCRLLLVLGVDQVVIHTFRLAKRMFGVHPYFWFHYLFVVNYSKDKSFHHSLDKMPQVFAYEALHVLWNKPLEPLADNVKKHIAENVSHGVYKLQWQIDAVKIPQGSNLAHLLAYHS